MVFYYYDRDDESHTARINNHNIDPGLEPNPHLTVEDVSCKSLRGAEAVGNRESRGELW